MQAFTRLLGTQFRGTARGTRYACYFTAYRTLQFTRYAIDVLRCLIVLVVALLYVIDGAHQVLKAWVDSTVEHALDCDDNAPPLQLTGFEPIGLLPAYTAHETCATATPQRREELQARTCPELRARLTQLGGTPRKLRKQQLIDRILQLEAF